MPKLIDPPVRPLQQIFAEATTIGADNVMLNDGEIGVILAGGTQPLAPRTICNWRHTGRWNAPAIRGSNRFKLTRLSDVLKQRDVMLRSAA